jgi:AraC-like DNA-binding protein
MLFDFTFYSSLLLPPFIHSVLFTVLLVVRGTRESLKSDLLLAALLLINALTIANYMLGFAGWYDSHDGYTTFMFYFPFHNDVWIGPLLYFYFLSLTNTQFRFSKKDLRHFILPGLWMLMIFGKGLADYIFYYPFPNIPDFQYGTKGKWAQLDNYIVMRYIGYISFFYYLYLTLTAFKKYQLYVKENFSSTEEISFTWLRNLLYAISTAVIVMVLFEFINFIHDGLSYTQDWFAYLAIGIVSYYLSIAGYFTRPVSLQHLNFIPEEEDRPIVENIEPEIQAWKTKLLSHIETKQPFLEPELTLNELAKQMNTNSSLLSKVINDGTGRNFNDFINHYRVREVIKKLKAGEQQTQTLLGIALDSGFNSKATFNRSFKKEMGKTPKEYIESLTTG